MNTLSSASRASSRLLQDEKGAILIIGIVMGTLLVGGLWHIASIGDAILFREHMQDAADSAAFESAVWNARGMNLLAMINILMSAVMAVLVVWRLAMMFITVALVLLTIACIAAAFPLTAPVAAPICALGQVVRAPLTNILTRMINNDTKVANRVHKIARGMMKAQRTVAVATPLMGAVASANDTYQAFKVSAVWPLSTSLFPAVEGMGINRKGCDDSSAGGNPKVRDLSAERIGTISVGKVSHVPLPSLPAQTDRFAVLCERAGAFIPNQVAGLLAALGGNADVLKVLDTFSDVMGKLVGAIPGYFCGANLIMPNEVVDQIRNATTEMCEGKKDNDRVFVSGEETEIMWRDESGKLVDEFDMEKCVDDEMKKQGVDGSSFPGRTECSQPVKVWDWAHNGNLMMQSFSAVDKEPTMLKRNDKGLEVADGNRTGNLQAAEIPQVKAQAEMYFDCSGNWESCRGNAMWSLRWRARLRRIQQLDHMLLDVAEVVTVEAIVNGAYKAFGRMVHNVAGGFEVDTLNLRDTWLTSQIRGAIRGQGHQVMDGKFRSVGAYLMGNPPTRSVVVH